MNRVVDPAIRIEDLVADPADKVAASGGLPHPRIPRPPDLFADRRNSSGLDLADEIVLRHLEPAVRNDTSLHHAAPMLADRFTSQDRSPVEIRNPADRRECVGTVVEADGAAVAHAVGIAVTAGRHWSALAVDARTACLERAADLMEAERDMLLRLAVREAGKTCANAVGEVREAVDFCRYHAAQARRELGSATALGPFACIAPWNFPLAIFVGQVSAALAAGNPVLAKPAEQTPLLAAAAVRLFHRAGVPEAALQLLPGRGETVGAALVADPRIAGVLFTGSTAVAQHIRRTLAGRDDDPVLIAETGGQNAMIVDSSALPEQAVVDALASAFDSAGQRCSALRILCLQEDIAAPVTAMLRGAMEELRVGDPRLLATDVGPVIDDDAHAALTAHVARMRAAGAAIHALPLPPDCAHGTFFPPTLIELDDPRQLTQEVFGPVLHVVRFREGTLPQLVDAINAAGYGLTHGIQTRIDETVGTILDGVHAGNVYVNRNIIGAVVGVQPFGGEGLSGTGPKAGGPHYLWRLVGQLAPHDAAGLDRPVTLPGPTGESNTLTLRPRGRVACLGPDAESLAAQARAATALCNVALVPASLARDAGITTSTASCAIVADPLGEHPAAVLFAGSLDAAATLRRRLAALEGPLVPLVLPRDGRYDVLSLTYERTVTINTTASGGNASLLSLEEGATS